MKISRFLLFLLISMNIKSEITIIQLKNYFIVFDSNHNHCSPLEGMIWWETNLIENIYRIASPNHATTKLVKLLFYLHQDGSFDVTRAPQQTLHSGAAAAYFTPEIIAELVGYLETNTTKDQIENLKKQITTKNFVQEFLKKHQKTFPSDGNYLKNLQRIFRLLCESQLECLSTNEDAQYIPYTTQRILLSYLWKKIHSQDELLDYVASLKTLLPKHTVIKPEFNDNYQTLLKTTYNANTLISYFNDINKQSALNLINENTYEIAICSLFFNKPASLISHASGVTYKGHEFSDCGEVAFLNFLNQLIYNKGTYDITLLETLGISVHPKLKSFYDKYPTPAEMKTKQVHDDWAVVMSEIPEVAYRTGGAQTVLFGELDSTSICNIAGIGCSQLDKIVKFLLGLNSFSEITKLSRPGFKLSYTLKDPAQTQFNTYIISINDVDTFEWQCTEGHFALTLIKNAPHNALLSDSIVKELLAMPLLNWPRACSLVTITQNTQLFEMIIKSANKPISLFNFACLIPNVKNADDTVEFLKLVLESYDQSPETYKPYLIQLIKTLFNNLPIDLYYGGYLSSVILEKKIEPLYDFMLNSIGNSYTANDKERLIGYILKRVLITNNRTLIPQVQTLYQTRLSSFEKFNFLQFIIQDEKKLLSGDAQQEWHDFAVSEFKKYTPFEQARIVNSIMYTKNINWNFFLIEHLNSYDWSNYVPETYERHSPLNPSHVLPQTIFSYLLQNNNDSTINSWLMNKFSYMNVENKKLALNTFKDMGAWNTWIKEHFHMLKSIEHLHVDLKVNALKILTAQNNPEMKEFIYTEIAQLLNYELPQVFNVIIQYNKQDFFDAIRTNFEKLNAQQKNKVCKEIILYNRLSFYDLIDSYLASADDYYRKTILLAITSNKFRYKDNSIQLKNDDDDAFSMSSHWTGQQEKGILITQDEYKKWYPLVTKWLLQITEDHQAEYVIKSIQNNNIQELLDIAQQRKACIKPNPYH